MSATPDIPLFLTDASGRPTTLADFSAACNTLRSTLAHVARSIANAKVDFEITDLRKGSAGIAVAPVLNGVAPPVLRDIRSTYVGTIDALQNGRPVDSRLDFDALRSFQGFFGPIGKAGVRLSVGKVDLNERYVENLRELLKPAAPALGSVSGKLEAVTVHNQRRFTLYPPVPNEAIDCNFEPSELESVLNAVGRHVTVYGTLYYAASKAFPVAVDVTEFEIQPDESALPTLLDACGSLPQSPMIQPEAWNNGW